MASTWVIRPGKADDADRLAELIAVSFTDVAHRFGFNRDNCPTHPSFITGERVERGMTLGPVFLMALDQFRLCGCVGIRRPADGISILEKLAVHPNSRHHGLGLRLVGAAVDWAYRMGALQIEIGIIAKQSDLREWYESLDFRPIRTARFAHLPFDVLYLRKGCVEL